MIKLDTKRGDFKHLEVSGNIVEITADVFAIIKTIYESISDEEQKEMFRKIIVENIEMGFGEEEEKNDKIDELIAILDDLNRVLDELIEDKDDEAVCNKD